MSHETQKVSRFELLMDAGSGAQKAGDILIQAFAATGRSVYIEPMIPAEISPPPRTKPALSGVIIRVADFSLMNIGNDTDFMIAAHEIVLDRRLDDGEHNEHVKVLLDMGDQKANEDSYERVLKRCAKEGVEVIPFQVVEEAKNIMKDLAGRGRNMYYLGMLSRIYSMPEENITKEIKRTFGKKLKEEILQKNIDLFHHGYEFSDKHVDFDIFIKDRKRTGERLLIDGNTALATGVIDAGFKLFSGYPITPASSIMHVLARHLPSYGGIVHQAEDEIAAIGTAIGSYYAGVPAITCTSGPGLSLKQEFIGYATAAEIPLVIIDAQRSGPSTGMPTKTEQSDLPAVVYGSHGDNVKIVISVGSIMDCFYAPHIARYLTEKLRVPVFIMTDFQTANSYKVIDKPQTVVMKNVDDIPDFILKRFRLQRLPDHIDMVSLNQSTPGTEGEMRRVTGLNTDAQGRINYFSGTNQRSHMIRNEKIHHVRRNLTEPEIFGKESNDVLVVGWGSTRGVICEAVQNCEEEGLAVSGLHLKIVYPLPLSLKDIFKRFKKVVTAELAYGDALKPAPLANMLRSETLLDIKSIFSEATGRPIRPLRIVEKVKELV